MGFEVPVFPAPPGPPTPPPLLIFIPGGPGVGLALDGPLFGPPPENILGPLPFPNESGRLDPESKGGKGNGGNPPPVEVDFGLEIDDDGGRLVGGGGGGDPAREECV